MPTSVFKEKHDKRFNSNNDKRKDNGNSLMTRK